MVLVLYLSCEMNENKQKEAGFGPFLKKIIIIHRRTFSRLDIGQHAIQEFSYLASQFVSNEV